MKIEKYLVLALVVLSLAMLASGPFVLFYKDAVVVTYDFGSSTVNTQRTDFFIDFRPFILYAGLVLVAFSSLLSIGSEREKILKA